MTPEEKARELVEKFKEYTEDKYAEHWSDAKACALICVDEIISEFEENNEVLIDGDYPRVIFQNQEKIEHWNKVKGCIQNYKQ